MKSALLVVICSFIVKAVGLLREILIAQTYGASAITDAYVIANNIPTVIFQAIGTALAATFIPVYADALKKEGEYKAQKFVICLLGIVFAVSFFILILGEIFARDVVYVFAPGFSEDTLLYAIPFTRIVFPTILFMGAMNILGAFLQYYQQFRVLMIVPVIGNVAIIFSLFLSEWMHSVYFFVWGTAIGISLQVMFYITVLRKKSIWKIPLCFHEKPWENHYVRAIFPMLIPVFIGSTVNDVNTVIGKALVSGFGAGGVSAFDYATKINMLVVGVVMGGMLTVFYPKMARLALQDDIEDFKRFVEKVFSITVFVLLFITVNIIVFHHSIISLIFERGKFDSGATEVTAQILFFLSLGLLGVGLREILSKVYYSMHDAKTPMVNGIFCAVVSIVSSLLLTQIMGVNGVALALSLGATISSLLLMIQVIRSGWISISYRDLSSMLFAALLMWKIESVLVNYFSLSLSIKSVMSEWLLGILVLFIGFFGYVIAAWLMGCSVLREYMSVLSQRLCR